LPYCPRCGVQLDASIPACPLCQTPIPRLDAGPGEPAWPTSTEDLASDPSKPYATSGQRRARALFATAAVLVTAAVIVTGVDLFTAGAVTWSRYPVVSFAAALAFTAAVLVWHRRPAVWATAGLVTTAALLGALDALHNGRLTWFPTLGLPVAATTFALATAGVLWVRRGRRRGYNLFSLVFGLTAAELLAVDGLVQGWVTGRPGWGWSVVAALVLVPLTVLFGVLHRTIRRTPDLRRTFHF